MAVYIYNFISLPVYSVICKNRKRFVIVASFQMFLILALRNNLLGVDLPNYAGGFQYIASLSFPSMISKLHFFHTADLINPFDYESGYVVLNWLISHLGFSFHGFLIVCAGINMAAIGSFIYRYSKIPWLSFLMVCALGTYTYMFGIIRQSLAVSMVLFAVMYALDDKIVKAIVLFILAFTFHRASFVALFLAPFLKKRQISKKKFILAFLGWVLFLIISDKMLDYLAIPILSFFKKMYSSHEMQMNNLMILLIVVMLATILLCDLNKAMKERINVISGWAIIFATYMETIGMYNDVFARGIQFFSVFLILLVPYVLSEYPDKRIVFVAKGACILLLLGYMVYSLQDDTVLVPYRTIWSA